MNYYTWCCELLPAVLSGQCWASEKRGGWLGGYLSQMTQCLWVASPAHIVRSSTELNAEIFFSFHSGKSKNAARPKHLIPMLSKCLQKRMIWWIKDGSWTMRSPVLPLGPPTLICSSCACIPLCTLELYHHMTWGPHLTLQIFLFPPSFCLKTVSHSSCCMWNDLVAKLRGLNLTSYLCSSRNRTQPTGKPTEMTLWL